MSYLSLWQRKGTPIRRMLFDILTGDAGETLYENTKTGNPASFETQIAKALKSLLVPFSPIQAGSGDPSPSNVRAISGFTGINAVRCGINLWDEEWETGDIDGNGQNTPGTDFRSKNYIPVVPGMTFYLYYELPNGQTPGSNIRAFYYDRNKTYISNIWCGKQAYTVPANCYYMRFYGDSRFGGVNDHVSINFPSTDTEYHAYTGNAYAVTFPDGQTIYGGSLDLVSGLLTVEYGIVDLGTLNWEVSSGSGSAKFFRSSVLKGAKKISSTGVLANIYCSIFKTVAASSIYSGAVVDNSIGQDDSSTARLRVKATSYNDDADAFGSAMDGVSLVYELATPQTIQLDPVTIQTLIGANTIWTDTNGSNTVVFFDKTQHQAEP